MQPDTRPIEIWRIAALTVAVCALLATVMVPALTGDAVAIARAETQRAVQDHLSDFPPPVASSYVGDQYYQWSTFVCPGGEYNPPAGNASPNALASVERPDGG